MAVILNKRISNDSFLLIELAVLVKIMISDTLRSMDVRSAIALLTKD